MSKKSQIHSLPLFASSLYYSKKDFQFPISAQELSITHPTVLKNNSGITLLFIKSGRGTVIVNTREYPIRRGILLCLGAYHYFQIVPGSEPVGLIQCRLSYDTFLYIAANPYYSFSELTLNVDPLTSLLEGDLLERTEKLADDLAAVSSRHKHGGGEKEFYLTMRLMGILQKTCNKDIWTNPPTNS